MQDDVLYIAFLWLYSWKGFSYQILCWFVPPTGLLPFIPYMCISIWICVFMYTYKQWIYIFGLYMHRCVYHGVNNSTSFYTGSYGTWPYALFTLPVEPHRVKKLLISSCSPLVYSLVVVVNSFTNPKGIYLHRSLKCFLIAHFLPAEQKHKFKIESIL